MKNITPKEFEEKFDKNENISDFVDWDNSSRVNDTPMRVSVDFPKWMIHSLDDEASHLGLSRQALIKLSVANHIKMRRY